MLWLQYVLKKLGQGQIYHGVTSPFLLTAFNKYLGSEDPNCWSFVSGIRNFFPLGVPDCNVNIFRTFKWEVCKWFIKVFKKEEVKIGRYFHDWKCYELIFFFLHDGFLILCRSFSFVEKLKSWKKKIRLLFERS